MTIGHSQNAWKSAVCTTSIGEEKPGRRVTNGKKDREGLNGRYY